MNVRTPLLSAAVLAAAGLAAAGCGISHQSVSTGTVSSGAAPSSAAPAAKPPAAKPAKARPAKATQPAAPAQPVPAASPAPPAPTPAAPAPTASPAPAAPTPASSASAEQQGLNALYAQLGPNDVTSAITTTPLGAYLVIAYSDAAATPAVNVYRWSGSAWAPQATGLSNDSDAPSIDPHCSNVTTVALTGSPVPDFAVNVCGMSDGASAVVTDAGGSWHLLPVRDNPLGADDPTLIGATFGSASVTTHVNTCTPDCADGNYEVTTYAYDPASGMLVATGPTSISRIT